MLTAMLAVTILLWAEAGLALIAGDQVMACRAMMMHSHAGTMAASDAADTEEQESAAMPCCPDDPAQAPAMTLNHPPCCSVSNEAERPLAFLVSSERTIQHPLDTAVEIARNFVPSVAQHLGDLRNADSPHFVRPILELKTDLRI